MSTIILFAIALITTVGLTLELGMLALLILPVFGLFFLLAIAPDFVEEMEAEFARQDSRTPAPAVRAGPAQCEPAVGLDSAGYGVLHLSDH